MTTRGPRAVDKIVSIEQLAAEVTRLRTEGRTVVMAHGVFDLLHIGHIRHFEAARAMGDALVVTITPDKFVNKGPHRPAFPAMLRAEAIAALDSVAFVAINRSQTAVDPIRRVRPNVYVKGADYRDAADDVTGGIRLERDAIEAVGGELRFTGDITFSSTTLVNRHLPLFPPNVMEFLASFNSHHSAAEVVGYLERARGLRVLVVGETIIDEYQYCEAIGKSSKEPMLAVRHVSLERFAGGILAVANNVAGFCDHVGVITVLGKNDGHVDFIDANLKDNVEQLFLYQEQSPTIVKRRLVENYFFSKLIEVYEMDDSPLAQADDDRLVALLDEQVPKYDMVLVVDFGHGMLSKRAIGTICSKARYLAVNTQSNAGNRGFHTVSRYPRADYVSLAVAELQLETRDLHTDLHELVQQVAAKLSADRVSLTRGKEGCICYSATEGMTDVPAFAGSVVDRMGAGDTFLSITALFAAQGAPNELVGFIGNVVGAEAVATVGHRESVQKASLYKHIESLMK